MMYGLNPRKRNASFLLILLISLFFSGSLKSQLVVDPNPNAQFLVDSMLTGSGVQISNVTVTGAPLQTGFFDATDANLLSIDSGVVMSTGAATGAIGPNNDQGLTSFQGGTGGASDPDLLMANGGTSVHDEIILEFDFVPSGDTVEFDYIFASEEYSMWVNNGYNDVFGFFISGPGINGPYSNNAENIATIPTTGQPVSIDNVNDNINSSFYIDNGDPDNGNPPPAPYSTDSSYIQYDGHTVVMTAKRAVQCDSTYHLKLALGDGGDDALDSGVLLRANSLSSEEITVDLDFGFGPNQNTVWEGSSVDLDITREDTSYADTVFLETGGVATEGNDYNFLPDTLFFQPGDSLITLTINAFDDNMTEGPESVTLDFIYQDSSSCGVWDTTEVEFFIDDTPPFQMNAIGDTTIGLCSDSIELWASADGGCQLYDWQWDQGLPDGDSVVTVSPDTTTTYVVSVSDTCVSGDLTDTITVTVPPYDPIDVHSSGDTSIVCPDDSATIKLDSISGGTVNTIFWWEGLGADSSYTVSPDKTTSYTLTAVDTCTDDTAIGTVQITRPFSPLQVQASPDTSVCTGSQVQLGVENVSGGVGDRELHWDPDSLIANSPTVQADTTAGSYTYTVTVTDSCGTTAQDSMIVNAQEPQADFTYQAEVLEVNEPIQFTSTSQGADHHFWEFDNGQFASTSDTTISYSQPGTYEVTLSVNDQIGCTDSISKLLDIEPPFSFFVPNAFTPDKDGINDVFRVEMREGYHSYHLRIFDRWGKLVFESKDPEEGWDGNIDGEPAPVGVYIYEVEVKGADGTNQSKEGHVTLIR